MHPANLTSGFYSRGYSPVALRELLAKHEVPPVTPPPEEPSEAKASLFATLRALLSW